MLKPQIRSKRHITPRSQSRQPVCTTSLLGKRRLARASSVTNSTAPSFQRVQKVGGKFNVACVGSRFFPCLELNSSFFQRIHCLWLEGGHLLAGCYVGLDSAETGLDLLYKAAPWKIAANATSLWHTGARHSGRVPMNAVWHILEHGLLAKIPAEGLLRKKRCLCKLTVASPTVVPAQNLQKRRGNSAIL